MEATPGGLSLPLHPRRAQQLFQEILLTDAQLTPHLSETPLPQRLQQLQSLNLSGIQEAKRGTSFHRVRFATELNPHSEMEQVTLRLSKDGSTLHVLADAGDALTSSLQLVDIQGIAVHTTPANSFSLQFDEEGNNATSSTPLVATDTFVASSASTLTGWVTALTCGVNAFQRQLEQQDTMFSDAKAVDLVWQAARLRIFELAQVMPLSEAIDHVKKSVPMQDLQQSEALRCRLQFLNSDLPPR